MIEEVGLGLKLLSFGKKYWPYIIGALVVAGLIAWALRAHHNAVKATYDKGYAAGVLANEKMHVEAAAKLATQQAAVTAPIRKTNDEANTRIAGDADDLRVSGPGKARAGCPAPAPAGQPVAADNQRPDAAPGPVPAADGQPDLAAVPWGWLVGRAEQADFDRAEVLAWRDWYSRQAELATKFKQKEQPKP